MVAESRNLVELILAAADCLRELLSPQLNRHGVNDARFTVMRAISDSPSGECSQTELARRLKQSEANVSTLLERMRVDELVTREKSPLDRRRSVVRLTERGQWLLASAASDYVQRAGELLTGIAAEEAHVLARRFATLLAIWEQELSGAESQAVAGKIGESAPPAVPQRDEPHAQAS